MTHKSFSAPGASSARLVVWSALSLLLTGIDARAQPVAPPASASAAGSLADYTLTNWAEEDGPFPFGIYAIAQDRDGYLWLGARTGLVRFDGSTFEPWKGPQPLPDDRISAILAASDGSLWAGFGTVGGVAHIRDGSARLFTTGDGLAEGDVNAIVQDPAGHVWVASHGGLAEYDSGRFRVIGESEGLPRAPVLGLFVDARGQLWVGTAVGLYRRSIPQQSFSLVEPGSDGDVAEDRAGGVWVSDPHRAFRRVGRQDAPETRATPTTAAGRGLLIDRQGALWVATRGNGLMRVHGESTGIEPARVEQLTRRQGLLSDEIRALFQDRNGSLWIGSRRGLSRLSLSNVRAVLNGDGADGFVAAVTVTSDGAVWTARATGLTRGIGQAERTYTERDGLPGRIVTALHEDRSGTLWAATTLGVARLVGQRFVPLQMPAASTWREFQIRTIASDTSGALWLCDQERGLFRWRNGVAESLADTFGQRKAYIVHADRSDRVWIGFWDGGLAVLDRERRTVYTSDQGLPQGSVTAILEDRSGHIWVATDRDLGRVEGDRVRTFGSNGFPRSGVVSMLEDGVGGMWFGLGPSLLKIDAREFDLVDENPRHRLRYRLYGAEDGLPGTLGRPGMPSSARMLGGQLLFITSVGLAVVDPRRLHDRPPPTQIRVSAVWADGNLVRQTNGGPPVSIPPQTARLALNYSILSLAAGRSRFRHQLEGFDSDWQDVGERREVSYTNLPPGSYRFRLASQHEDTWIEAPLPLELTILPAFYQTRAFAATAASATILLFWFGWRRRVRQLQREFDLVLAERSRVGREIHDTLLQSLVAVALEFDDISEQLDPAKAALKAQVINIRTRVEQYILEARQSIANLRSPILQQTDLSTALKQTGEAATANHGIRFEFALLGIPKHLDETLEEQLLRIGQEAVSNAVRHGAAKVIHMELCFDAYSVRLRVTDDGRGFDLELPQDVTAHWGIAGMRERAEKVGARLRLVSQPGAGTTVEAMVPLMAHE